MKSYKIINSLHRPINESNSDGRKFDRHTSIPALTGLRGLAAILVFVVHMRLPEAFLNRYEILVHYKELGWVGVPLFFVLSGYLITRLGLEEIGSTGGFHLWRFYARRAIRILPLYLAATAVGITSWSYDILLPRTIATDPTWSMDLLSFTLNMRLCSTRDASGLGSLVPLWTIAVELQFYLAWGIALRFLSRRNLAWVAIALIIGSIAARFLVNPTPFVFYRMHTAVAMGSLMSGCLVALGEGTLRRVVTSGRIFALIAAVGFMNVGFLAWPFPTNQQIAAGLVTIVDLLSMCMIVAAILPGSVNARILDTPILLKIGEASYPIYLFHYGGLMYYYQIRQKIHGNLPDPTSLPLISVATDFLISWCIVFAIAETWTRLESPLKRLRQRLH